jgi:hypothetical protein
LQLVDYNPPDLHFPSGGDYRYEPPHLATFSVFLPLCSFTFFISICQFYKESSLWYFHTYI